MDIQISQRLLQKSAERRFQGLEGSIIQGSKMYKNYMIMHVCAL